MTTRPGQQPFETADRRRTPPFPFNVLDESERYTNLNGPFGENSATGHVGTTHNRAAIKSKVINHARQLPMQPAIDPSSEIIARNYFGTVELQRRLAKVLFFFLFFFC